MDERDLKPNIMKKYETPQMQVVEFEGPNVLLNDSGVVEIED